MAMMMNSKHDEMFYVEKKMKKKLQIGVGVVWE